jgi:hypothetical protein
MKVLGHMQGQYPAAHVCAMIHEFRDYALQCIEQMPPRADPALVDLHGDPNTRIAVAIATNTLYVNKTDAFPLSEEGRILSNETS